MRVVSAKRNRWSTVTIHEEPVRRQTREEPTTTGSMPVELNLSDLDGLLDVVIWEGWVDDLVASIL